MTKSKAVSTLEEIEGLLRDVGRLDSLSPSQRAALASRALSAVRDIDDVVRLVKRLDREVKGSLQQS
jgi:hypothetical protein